MEEQDELREIREGLEEVIHSEYVDTWLHAPNGAFENRKPIDVIRKGESGRIRDMIRRLRSGEPS